jgi:CheY-like chemotaxis protein
MITTELIREVEEKLCVQNPIPIIALTAHALDIHKEEYLSIGMNEHLTKPINRTLLLETIRKFISISNEY